MRKGHQVLYVKERLLCPSIIMRGDDNTVLIRFDTEALIGGKLAEIDAHILCQANGNVSLAFGHNGRLYAHRNRKIITKILCRNRDDLGGIGSNRNFCTVSALVIIRLRGSRKISNIFLMDR